MSAGATQSVRVEARKAGLAPAQAVTAQELYEEVCVHVGEFLRSLDSKGRKFHMSFTAQVSIEGDGVKTTFSTYDGTPLSPEDDLQIEKWLDDVTIETSLLYVRRRPLRQGERQGHDRVRSLWNRLKQDSPERRVVGKSVDGSEPGTRSFVIYPLHVVV